jgi:iduronate 2-sulfatase
MISRFSKAKAWTLGPILALSFSLGTSLLSGAEAPQSASRPNVLFITIDDLRNDLGALGVSHAKTPHLDQLARSSRLFTNHYVQVPTCGASRCALLRGQYPDVKAQVSNNAIRDTQSEWADRSMPAWWRQHGYRTYSLGKISHYPGGLTGGDWNTLPEELPGVWDRSWIPDSPWTTSLAMMHGYANGKPRERGVTPPWEAVDESDHAYPDAWVADDAITHLNTLAKSSEPWFFAVGFFKPHLPFAAPRKWLEIHDAADMPVPEIEENATARPGWHNSGELRNGYDLGGRDPFEDEAFATELRRTYAGSISYMDEQVGRVMKELEALNLADNTIVVVWSDHGYLLGEHQIWAKHTLYEEALKSPLMIRMPGLKAPGEQANSVVETVDIYPTLLELCGLPSPGDLDGTSLVPQLGNPAEESKKPALGFWSDWRTVRDQRWRLTVYPDAKDGNPVRELMDLENDPHSLRNVADENPKIVARLMKKLRPAFSE